MEGRGEEQKSNRKIIFLLSPKGQALWSLQRAGVHWEQGKGGQEPDPAVHHVGGGKAAHA